MSDLQRRSKANTPAAARVVLLLGWTGAKDRHLSAYKRKLYDPAGYHSVMFNEHNRTPLRTILQPKTTEKYALEALQVIEKTKPSAVHLFSNGGGLLWAKMMDLASAGADRHEDEKGVRDGCTALQGIKHLVMDSSPGNMDSWNGFWRFLLEFFRGPRQRVGLYLASPVIFMYLFFNYVVNLRFLPGNSRTDKYHRDLLLTSGNTGVRDILFMYSDGDVLIQSADVEAFSRKVNNGTDVRTRLEKFANTSRHVAHMIGDFKRYKTTLFSFLDHKTT